MAQAAADILAKYREIVYPIVAARLTPPVYPPQFRIPDQYQSEFDFIKQTITEYPSRKGKYFRPTLLYLSSIGLGGNSSAAALAAAAMQISEEWLLIHDDYEDGSLQRRGRPTLHLQYSDQLAVNAGDALHAVMWHTLFQVASLLPSPINENFVDEFYTMIHRTIIGQGVEIKWFQDNKPEISDADWFFIADGKTSYYTVAGPLRLGAILSGALPAQIESLTDFGIVLGRCYQLTDDILDITSDFSGQKNQQGHDIYEGKRTIPLGHLLSKAGPADRQKILSILAKPHTEKTAAEVNWIISEMDRLGSLTYSRELASQLKNQAIEMLNTQIKSFLQPQSFSELAVLTDFVLSRKY